ncbi:MAG: PRC-barrel domain-containing protein [Aliihoeflea sp.]
MDEIVGAEVRSADDKIDGEVRNVVIGTKDQWDYAVVASEGFFHPWQGQHRRSPSLPSRQ